MKPGYKTTEFWMNLIAMALTSGGLANPEVVDTVTSMLPVVVSGIYTIGRSIVKAFER